MNTADIVAAYNAATVAKDVNAKEPFGVRVRLAIGKTNEKLLYLPFGNDIAFLQPMKLSISKSTPQEFINSYKFEKRIYELLVELSEKAKESGEKIIIKMADIDKDNSDMLHEAFGNNLWVEVTPKVDTSEDGEAEANFGW